MSDSGRSPGCAVGVVEGGQLRYARGYGLANVATSTPITPHSVFGIASLAKQFTAFSILLLAEDKRLSLDDDVRKWIPEIPNVGGQFGRPVTIRDLLHHTSGIPNYFAKVDSGWTDTDPLTERDVLEWLARQKPQFAAGSRWRYSNSGYVLLEIIVHRASGDALPAFAKKHIFAPLGMTSTQYVPDLADHVGQVPHLARAYISRETWVHGDQPVVTGGPEWQTSLPRMSIVGDAGLYTTVEDLAKWDRNFYTGKVGGHAVLQLMQEPAILTSGDTVSAAIAPGWFSYGAGVMLGAYRGLRTVGHLGGWAGNVAWFVRYPEQRFAVAVLCNQRGFTMGAGADPSHRIAEIYLEDRMAPDIVPLIATTIAERGADSAVTLYHALRARYPAIAFNAQQLNSLGYDLIRQHKLDAAIVVFRLNVEMYPGSANAYDSLGEAYADHGDRALAISSYERSLVLDSTNANAARQLAKLRAQAP